MIENEVDKRKVASEIIDSWLSHQDELLIHFDKQNRAQLKQICEAAERAHLLLELMMPFLAPRPNHEYVSIRYYTDRNGPERLNRTFDANATARCDAVLAAWAKAARAGHELKRTRLTRAIPQRAQHLLERMEWSYRDLDDSKNEIVVKPSVESYNRVMETWTYSHEHLRGSRAENIFAQLVGRTASGSRPNGESFRLIVSAWALSGERRAAFTATGHLMKMLRRLEKGDEDMEPALEDYKVIFKAWTTAEDKASPGKAMSVLRLMEYAKESGHTDVEPDYECFKYLLQVASRRPLLNDVGKFVDQVLQRMDGRLFIPDTECFEAAIETWKNVAMNPDLYDIRDLAVKRVLQLLHDMKYANDQSSTVSVRPTTVAYNDAIKALSMSSNPRRTNQAERLVDELEENLDGAGNGPIPDASTYRSAIEVWRDIPYTEKVPRAKSLLWRMQSRYTKLTKRGDGTVNDFVGVFNAFIRVCSAAAIEGEEKQKAVFRDALAVVEEMKDCENLRANADTYTALLEACDKLLEKGADRIKIIETIFRTCCANGMVDENLLLQLRVCLEADQYQRLVVSFSEEFEGERVVPESWTSNSLGGRVVTADGRRTKPLSIEGKLATTKSMLDFRMRRLSDKRNRNLLRGGRLVGAVEKTGAGSLMIS